MVNRERSCLHVQSAACRPGQLGTADPLKRATLRGCFDNRGLVPKPYDRVRSDLLREEQNSQMGRTAGRLWCPIPGGRRALRVHGVDRTRRSSDSVGPGRSAQEPSVLENSILTGVAPGGPGCVGRPDACGSGGECGERTGISKLSKMVRGATISPGEAGRNILPLAMRSGADVVRTLRSLSAVR